MRDLSAAKSDGTAGDLAISFKITYFACTYFACTF